MYVTIGDLGAGGYGRGNVALNNLTGRQADGTGGILRLTQDGEPVSDPDTGEYILDNSYPLNLYYAYGIRNSFGIDFDPVTGNLWDTENGPGFGDEINLVDPGFNSGWDQVIGVWASWSSPEERDMILAPKIPDTLVNFHGNGQYIPPKLTWLQTIGPTAIKFLNSDRYGDEYENDVLVADFNIGNIYHFDLNNDRDELALNDPLTDRIVSKNSSLESKVFWRAPGGITDLQIGPDGYLYVVSVNVTVSDCDPDAPGCLAENEIQGSIFKLVPVIQ